MALAFCIGLQFNTSTYSSEYLSQALKAVSSTASSYWQSVQNTVNSWSTETKIAIASLILAGFAAYNKEAFMTVIDDTKIKAKEMMRKYKEQKGLAVDFRYFPDSERDETGKPIVNEGQVNRFKRDIEKTRGKTPADKIKRYQRRQEVEGYVRIGNNPDFIEAQRQLEASE